MISTELTIAIGPQRSLWVIIVTPLVLFIGYRTPNCPAVGCDEQDSAVCPYEEYEKNRFGDGAAGDM